MRSTASIAHKAHDLWVRIDVGPSLTFACLMINTQHGLGTKLKQPRDWPCSCKPDSPEEAPTRAQDCGGFPFQCLRKNALAVLSSIGYKVATRSDCALKCRPS